MNDYLAGVISRQRRIEQRVVSVPRRKHVRPPAGFRKITRQLQRPLDAAAADGWKLIRDQ